MEAECSRSLEVNLSIMNGRWSLGCRSLKRTHVVKSRPGERPIGFVVGAGQVWVVFFHDTSMAWVFLDNDRLMPDVNFLT